MGEKQDLSSKFSELETEDAVERELSELKSKVASKRESTTDTRDE